MSVLHLTLKQPAQMGERDRSDAVRDPGRARLGRELPARTVTVTVTPRRAGSPGMADRCGGGSGLVVRDSRSSGRPGGLCPQFRVIVEPWSTGSRNVRLRVMAPASAADRSPAAGARHALRSGLS